MQTSYRFSAPGRTEIGGNHTDHNNGRVLAAAVDCALWLLAPGRGEALPYTAAAGLALCFAQWGISRESRGSYDSFRLASLDDHPPYLVTVPASRGETCGAFTPPPCGMIMPPVFRRCSCR